MTWNSGKTPDVSFVSPLFNCHHYIVQSSTFSYEVKGNSISIMHSDSLGGVWFMVNVTGKQESEPHTYMYLCLDQQFYCVEWELYSLLAGKSLLPHPLGYPFPYPQFLYSSFPFPITIPTHYPNAPC